MQLDAVLCQKMALERMYLLLFFKYIFPVIFLDFGQCYFEDCCTYCARQILLSFCWNLKYLSPDYQSQIVSLSAIGKVKCTRCQRTNDAIQKGINFT